jgi:hypothetical protein
VVNNKLKQFKKVFFEVSIGYPCGFTIDTGVWTRAKTLCANGNICSNDGICIMNCDMTKDQGYCFPEGHKTNLKNM